LRDAYAEILGLAFTPDGQRLAAGLADGSLVLWQPHSGHKVCHFSGRELNLSHAPLAFRPDGYALVHGVAGTFRALYAGADVVESSRDRLAISLPRAQFARNAQVVVQTGTAGTTVFELAGEEGSEKRSFYVRMTRGVINDAGTHLAGALVETKTIALFRLADQKQVGSIPRPSFTQECLALGPRGETLAVAGTGGELLLFGTSTSQRLQTLQEAGNRCTCLSFSPTGRLLAVGDATGAITLWNVVSGQSLRKLSGHRHQINGLTFSADETWLAAASSDRTASLWSLATGQLSARIETRSELEQLVFRPCQPRPQLVLFGRDGGLFLWDTARGGSGEPATTPPSLLTWQHTEGTALHGDFSPDGRWMRVLHNNGALHTWNLIPPSFLPSQPVEK